MEVKVQDVKEVKGKPAAVKAKEPKQEWCSCEHSEEEEDLENKLNVEKSEVSKSLKSVDKKSHRKVKLPCP